MAVRRLPARIRTVSPAHAHPQAPPAIHPKVQEKLKQYFDEIDTNHKCALRPPARSLVAPHS